MRKVYSMSHVIASVTFWQLFIKIHIPEKETQIKLIKGKLFKKFSFSNWHFHSQKITITETNFLRKFTMGNVSNFSPFVTHSKYLAQFFQCYHTSFFHTCPILTLLLISTIK